MATEVTGYRFQDGSDEALVEQSEIVHSVEFHPSIEDYAAVLQKRSTEHATFTPWSKFCLQAFFMVNALGLPAALLFFNHPLIAVGSLALNLLFALFFLPAVFRSDYRRYLRSVYGPDFENELVIVELTHYGIRTHHRGDSSFFSWKNVRGIDETGEAIMIHLQASSLPIRKSGFPYVEQERSFVEFARARQNENRTGVLTQ